MRHNFIVLISIMAWPILALSQKMSNPETYNLWKTIENTEISSYGNWVHYSLSPGKGDDTLYLYNTITNESISFPRASSASFDYEENFLAFIVGPALDTIETLKRQKVEKADFPQDTLVVYHLKEQRIERVPNVESFKLSKEYGGGLAVKIKAGQEADSTAVKKQNEKNGSQLFVYDFNSDSIRLIPYVKDYGWSNKNGILYVESTGQDSSNVLEIKLIDLSKNQELTLLHEEARLHKYGISESGKQLAVVLDKDSLDTDIASTELYYWNAGKDILEPIADSSSQFILDDHRISPYMRPWFSDEENRLYFGIHHMLPQPDSTLLDTEKVELEIWNFKDEVLYTQQKKNLKREKERSFTTMYDIDEKRFHLLHDDARTGIDLDPSFQSSYFLSYNSRPYEKYTSWIGYAFKDVYLYNLKDDNPRRIAERIQGNPRMSPDERYVYWFSRPDTSWYAYDISEEQLNRLTKKAFYDEDNDRPMHPYNSGFVGWTKDDEAFIIYDEYDLWKLNPDTGQLSQLTNGRKDKIRFRHIALDRDIDFFPANTTLLLSLFDEKDKSSGYAYLNLESHQLDTIFKEAYRYNTRITKAEKSDKLLFTKESFVQFPDLILSDTQFKDQKSISNANPQQSQYDWGSIELFKWKNYEGEESHGLLVKPLNFDPSKKYPLIVNFYEKSSHRLHEHRAPYPHRSVINYSYWANKGYVIFNPDVKYRVGYPGQSCYDAVMSGVDALLKLDFIDETRMGLQGHSWGGYQIADLITKTNRFACAEAGAPVVNMTSAYGGIRWRTGRSRMFQYEQTQSRLGASLWEDPELYLVNSPLFNLDKVETPVLILHNDQDGAVPWYQGIEYFVAMRRLGKPAWLLNYNNEPHWPVKRQNRLDFNKRLEQFFDHYLMGKAPAEWMSRGVPAVEAEFNDGLSQKDE